MTIIENETTSTAQHADTAAVALYLPTPAAFMGEDPTLELCIVEAHDGTPVEPLHVIATVPDTGVWRSELREDPYLDPEVARLVLGRRGFHLTDAAWHTITSGGCHGAWAVVEHDVRSGH